VLYGQSSPISNIVDSVYNVESVCAGSVKVDLSSWSGICVLSEHEVVGRRGLSSDCCLGTFEGNSIVTAKMEAQS